MPEASATLQRLAHRAADGRVAWAVAAPFVALAAWRAGSSAVWDGDIWWILRAGEDALRTHAVPTVNGYAFTSPEHPWVMHEWLYGVGAAMLVRAFGVAGLALGRLGAVALLALAMLWRAGRDARPVVASLAFAVAFEAFGARWESPRPVGTVAALAVAAAAVAFDPAFRARHLVALAAIQVLWTNVHGSHPLGVAIAACAAFEPTGDRRARRAAVLAVAGATLCNPYGLAMHDLVRRYVLGEGGDSVALVHERIREWWPLWRHPMRTLSTPLELVAALPLAVGAFTALRSPRWRPRGVLLVLLFTLALRHNRHLQLFGLASLVLLAAPLEAVLARLSARTAATFPPRRAMAVFAVVGLATWGAAWVHRPAGEWRDPTHDDEDVAALLDATPADARVFVTLFFTGFAIERGVRVFFDTRNDCYPYDVLREGFDLDAGKLAPVEAERVLRRRGVTHALVRCDGAARTAFAGWTLGGRRGAYCLLRATEERAEP